MPQEPTSHIVRNILLFLAIIVFLGVVFLWAQKPVPPADPVPTPKEKTEEIPVVEAPRPEPARVPVDIQSQIDAIALKVDRGEITIEEGQRQANLLLTIEE